MNEVSLPQQQNDFTGHGPVCLEVRMAQEAHGVIVMARPGQNIAYGQDDQYPDQLNDAGLALVHPRELNHRQSASLSDLVYATTQHPETSHLPVGIICTTRELVDALVASRDERNAHSVGALLILHDDAPMARIDWSQITIPTRFVCNEGQQEAPLLTAISQHATGQADLVRLPALQGSAIRHHVPLGQIAALWFSSNLLVGRRRRSAA